MYISLLDYLEEIKKKFYILIFTILLFLFISLGYKFYKDDHYEINYSSNFVKLSGFTLSKYNFEASPGIAIEWIGNEATSNFNNKEDKIGNLIMKCEKDIFFLKCKVSGKIKNNLDEIKNQMYLAILNSFEDYEIYVVNLIEEIINSRKDLFNYVEDAEDTSIQIKASYKEAIKEIMITKNLFLDLYNRAKIKESDIIISEVNTKINYFILIIGGLISGLFLIFLQMTGRNKLS